MITLPRKFDLEFQNDFKTQPIMYCIGKMKNIPVGARFIVASRKCSTKALSKAFTKASKLPFKPMRSFHQKSHFYTGYKKLWVVENSKLQVGSDQH